ncbi:hypothetical protein CGCS363_v013488 [Colletotrichum siamense]|uniref:uncharacterized protein n=1 Tax=Colletotrichum siamense TaxID=690259 RepID=UPI001872C8C7|nr:uncharacterized protein CGCS363_v013488 [Colletotrichum siamense]KAF5487008.1 hypothetical protein CGCS363_v013488 [Colletotrichum siamense]
MTTAHGILDQMSLHEEQEGLTGVERETDYTFWNTDLCESDLDERESKIDGGEDEEDFIDPDEDSLGQRDASKVARWQPFDGVVGINFLGKLYSDKKHAVNAISSSDYALLRTKAFDGFSNRPFSALDTAEITSFVANHELEQGPVSVILGLDNVAQGTLLPRATSLPFSNGKLLLRTVELAKPLARGTSGAWLIKDTKFVGMIVAAYAGEPLALFMSAEDIIVNILMSFPAETNLPTNEGSFGATTQHSQNAPSIQAPTSTSSIPMTAIKTDEALHQGSKEANAARNPSMIFINDY